jgi:hypothetical protein
MRRRRLHHSYRRHSRPQTEPTCALHVLAILFALFLISPLFLSAARSIAETDDNESRILVQDIVAYFDRCKDVHERPPTLLSSCVNEKAELLRRQHDLHVSDTEVNAQLRGRGGFGRWP